MCSTSEYIIKKPMLNCYDNFTQNAIHSVIQLKPETFVGFNTHHAKILLALISTVPDCQNLVPKIESLCDSMERLQHIVAISNILPERALSPKSSSTTSRSFAIDVDPSVFYGKKHCLNFYPI